MKLSSTDTNDGLSTELFHTARQQLNACSTCAQRVVDAAAPAINLQYLLCAGSVRSPLQNKHERTLQFSRVFDPSQ
jgi:hypothetical protein